MREDRSVTDKTVDQDKKNFPVLGAPLTLSARLVNPIYQSRTTKIHHISGYGCLTCNTSCRKWVKSSVVMKNLQITMLGQNFGSGGKRFQQF